MTSPVKNQVYTAEILGYSSEGLGIARIHGQVVFVHDAIRGEVCDILIMKVGKSAAFGKAVAWHTVSPHRREPDCPYYRRCGGAYRHMDYAEELWAKGQRVQDALTRLGGSHVQVEEILGASQPLHYRNKSQYPVSPDGKVGFYRARTHCVTDLTACLIQKPQADAAAGALMEARLEAVPGAEKVFDFGTQSYADPKVGAQIARRAARRQDAAAALARVQAAQHLVGAELSAGCWEQDGKFLLLLGTRKGCWLRTVYREDGPGLWLLDMIRRAACGLPQVPGTSWQHYRDPVPEAVSAPPAAQAEARPAPPKKKRRWLRRVLLLLVALALAALAAGWWFTGGDLTALPQLLRETLHADRLPHSGAKLI